MRRRDFGLLICAATVAPQALLAQTTSKQFRVGWLLFPAKDASLSVKYIGDFWNGMGDLGYTEGENVEMLYRFGDFHADRMQPLATELAQLKPDVLVAFRDAQCRRSEKSDRHASHCRCCARRSN
jgi:putative tryptophan/tyrosine transport system substrate-binding protein